MGRAGRQAVQQLHSCGRSRDYLARRTSGGGVAITGEYLVIVGWPAGRGLLTEQRAGMPGPARSGPFALSVSRAARRQTSPGPKRDDTTWRHRPWSHGHYRASAGQCLPDR